jgi:hypothetical protein
VVVLVGLRLSPRWDHPLGGGPWAVSGSDRLPSPGFCIDESLDRFINVPRLARHRSAS